MMKRATTLLCCCAVTLLCCWNSSLQAAQSAHPKGRYSHITKINIRLADTITGKITEETVRAVLPIKEGDVYTPKKLDQTLDYLRKWGVFEVIEAGTGRTADGIEVTFRLNEAALIGEININGNYPYIDAKVRKYLTIRPGDIYTSERVEEQIKRIAEFYEREGYLNTSVTTRHIWNENSKDVKIIFDIKRGEVLRYGNISIGGMHAYPRGRIISAINPLKPYNQNRFNDAIRGVAEFYHAHGYPRARIKVARHEVEAGRVNIAIEVNEGPKTIVRFIGNRGLSDRRIKKSITLDEYEIEVSEQAITELYHKNGFLEARVTSARRERKDGALIIEFHVDEGLRQKIVRPAIKEGKKTLTIVEKIIFEGNASLSDKILLKQFKNKAGKPLNDAILPDEKQALLVFYADNGFPYAEIKQTVESAVIKYEIIEGPLVKIGRILTVGNSLTSNSAIKKAMTIKEGERFSYKEILESQQALRRLGAFNTVSVDTIGLEEKEDVIHLRVKVEEQKPFTLDFELNYSTDERYSGSMSFTNQNAFGWAKRANLKLTGGRELSRAEGNWTDPRFLGSDLELTTSTWLQYEDKNIYNYMQAGGGFGFTRRYHRTSFLVKHQLERNYFVEGDSTAADADSLRDNTISKVTLSGSFDTRNSFGDPTRGVFAMMNADFYNEIRGKNANFVKLRWFFGYYLEFLKRFSLSHNFRLDKIQTLGDNVSIPTNELFFLGGDDTLRGFTEDSLGPENILNNPTGGRVRWIYNGELRIRLFKKFQWAFFYDTGALVNEFKDIDLSTIRQSAGLGLRYITPVGPIRLDYGFILDKLAGDHVGRLHFTFGHVF